MTQFHYPILPHLSEAYNHLGNDEGNFRVTEYYGKHIVSLPIFEGMLCEEVDHVVETVNLYTI